MWLSMKPPMLVRPLTDAERQQLEAGLRSSDAFCLRRCQILLASARGERASQIGRALSCDDQTVRAPPWALGFEDEVWWRRLARPALKSWAEAAQPLHLVEQTVAHDDPDPKALACYGRLMRWMEPTGPPPDEAAPDEAAPDEA